MEQALVKMITLFIKNNKKYFNCNGYLHFENTNSIELSPKDEKKLKTHWLDGVTLDDKGNVVVYTSTINSTETKDIELAKLPKSLHTLLLKKIAEEIAYLDSKNWVK